MTAPDRDAETRQAITAAPGRAFYRHPLTDIRIGNGREVFCDCGWRARLPLDATAEEVLAMHDPDGEEKRDETSTTRGNGDAR